MMRITVSHRKGRREAMRAVESAVDQFMHPIPGPMKIENLQKKWTDSTLEFSFTAEMMIVKEPVRGTIEVEEFLITIDVELPSALTKLFPEDTIRTAVESRIRGMLR